MDFETALAFISGVFLLVGIVGRVGIQSLRVGTDSPVARATTIAVGLVLMLIALNQRLHLFDWSQALPSQTSVSREPGPRALGYFIVVSSSSTEVEAIKLARRLTGRGYSAEVHRTSSGYLAVAVRAQSAGHRSQVYASLLSEGLAGEEAFLSAGKRFQGKVYP